MSRLTKLLLKEKRYDDLERAVSEESYREELMKKCNL